MSKQSFEHHILIVGDKIHEIEEIAQLLHDRIVSPTITIIENLEISEEKLRSLKFNIIILVTENLDLNIMMDGIIKIPVILISDSLTIHDISTKITYQKNNAFEHLSKSELNSLLLFKSIVYMLEKNNHYIKHKVLQRQYHTLFQMNPLPMWIYDLEFLKFLRVNDAAIRKYGFSRDEFMNMTIKDIRPPEDVIKLEEAVDLVRKHKTLFSNGIYRHKKKDGSIIYVEIVSNIIYIDKLKYELVLANDITESLNYIQAIESQNSKLQEIAFAHSHIIRAPLANMLGILNLVKEMDLNSPESGELLDHLFTSCSQLDEKITEVVKKSSYYSLTK
ncbi:PAS domain S-box protein [Flavobacterium sp.]|uniref:PAS domain S-box protein n=1 Tax=Flavobacterium sp. TaxID=239 RepID=UPI003266C8E6